MLSRLSANLGKMEPLQSTPYVEECCIEIEKQQEHPSDSYLVFQVRLHNIADAAIRTFPFYGVDYWGKMGAETIFMLVKSFEESLDRFKSTIDPELMQSSMYQPRQSRNSVALIYIFGPSNMPDSYFEHIDTQQRDRSSQEFYG